MNQRSYQDAGLVGIDGEQITKGRAHLWSKTNSAGLMEWGGTLTPEAAGLLRVTPRPGRLRLEDREYFILITDVTTLGRTGHAGGSIVVFSGEGDSPEI